MRPTYLTLYGRVKPQQAYKLGVQYLLSIQVILWTDGSQPYKQDYFVWPPDIVTWYKF